VKTLADLRTWLEMAPAGTSVPAASVLALLAEIEPASLAPVAAEVATEPRTWREKLWTCPGETRLGVEELCEALGRPKSWLYRHTSAASGYERIPHRKTTDGLVFVASEIRAWIEQQETVVVSPITPVTSITPARRGDPLRRAS